MLKRRAALLALLLGGAVTGCGAASAASRHPSTYRGTGGLKTVSVSSGGHERTYLLYVPPGDARNHRLPLVLVYHGVGDTASHTTTEVDLLSIAERRHDMIVVFPQGYQDSWNEGAGHTPAAQAGINDVAFTATILRRVESSYAVNPQRVVAAGFSNGALLAEYLGCALAKQLTLIVPVEGELPESVSSSCHPASPISVYEIHGTADQEIPYNGGSFNGVGGGTTVLSAPNSADRWAALDGCAKNPANTSSGRVALSVFSGCGDHVTVTLAAIQGGQHVWPQNFGQTVVSAMSSLPSARRASL